MKIIIPYESKWSVSLLDKETGLTKFKSVGEKGLAKKTGTQKTYIYHDDDYESIMKRVNENHKNFDYRTIEESTVLGICARLLGEIRYMEDALMDDDHIIHKLKDKITFKLKDRDIYNEIVSLSTPLKPSQNNGQGLIKKNKDNALLFENDCSKVIYAMLNIKKLKQLKDVSFMMKKNVSFLDMNKYLEEENLLEKNIEIYKFFEKFDLFDSRFSKFEKSYKSFLNEPDKNSEDVMDYISILKDLGDAEYNDEQLLLNKPDRVMAGVLVYSTAYWLIRVGYKNEVENFIFNRGGGIAGIATLNGIAKNIGAFTKKDLYSYFGEGKYTFSSPYIFNMKSFKKESRKEGEKNLINIDTKLGLGKEDGILEIDINVTKEEAIALKEQIENVGVSTFQMGKKGLAYVRRIEL